MSGFEFRDKFIPETGRGLAGEQSGAGGRADRCGGMGVGELHPLAGKAIDVWGAVMFVAGAAEIMPAEIVRE